MPRTFAIYVPTTPAAHANMEVGLAYRVWGWKDAALDRGQARQAAASLAPGDMIVMGTGGGNPRVAQGGWQTGRLQRVVFLRVARGLYRDNNVRWADEIYPNRIDLQVLSDFGSSDADQLGAPTMEALRWSANTMGVPVEVMDRSPLISGVTESLSADADPLNGRLDHDGEMDALALVLVRREQRKIRALKFGDAQQLRCDLCGRSLPARFVRAAHIKPRALCNLEEMRNLSNIMAACLFGCDELFEHGYVGVADDRTVIARTDVSGDVALETQRLAGRSTTLGMGPSVTGFLTWHRERHGLSG